MPKPLTLNSAMTLGLTLLFLNEMMKHASALHECQKNTTAFPGENNVGDAGLGDCENYDSHKLGITVGLSVLFAAPTVLSLTLLWLIKASGTKRIFDDSTINQKSWNAALSNASGLTFSFMTIALNVMFTYPALCHSEIESLGWLKCSDSAGACVDYGWDKESSARFAVATLGIGMALSAGVLGKIAGAYAYQHLNPREGDQSLLGAALLSPVMQDNRDTRERVLSRGAENDSNPQSSRMAALCARFSDCWSNVPSVNITGVSTHGYKAPTGDVIEYEL